MYTYFYIDKYIFTPLACVLLFVMSRHIPFSSNQKPGADQSMITFFIQSIDSRVNYQPIRYLFNGITLEMNLLIYKAMKGVRLISWLMTAEPKGLNKIDWEAIKAIGQKRRYNILVISYRVRSWLKHVYRAL